MSDEVDAAVDCWFDVRRDVRWGAGAESGVSAGGASKARCKPEQLLCADAGFIAGADRCVHDQEKAPAGARAEFRVPRESVAKEASYFAGVAGAGASFLAYLRRKRSTRPAVSMSFCLPVKKGWQAEQISTLMSPLWLDRKS